MPLSELDSINMKYVRNCVSPAGNRYSASASVINDLLLVKSKLADVSVLSSTDVDFIIVFLVCVCFNYFNFFSFFFSFVYCCTIFIINK